MLKTKRKKIIVAMSGGVDSSVAAKILKDQGHEVVGIFLHFWQDDKSSEDGNKGCALTSLQDARRVCQIIGMPLYTLNFSEVFKKEVVDNFLDEYKKGQTPNPCVRCNKLVKLGLLISRAKELGFDYVASGHYAKNLEFRIRNSGPKYKLCKARDENKDQSYFLYTLNQEELKHLIFPLGDYTKQQVRQLAKKFGLPVAQKRDSQEVCFIPDKNHNAFLKRNLKLKSGPIFTLDGKKVGEHKGLPLYTVGQRKEVEVGGVGPFYVDRCDYKNNILHVVKDGHDPSLYNNKLIATEVNWVAGQEPKLPMECGAIIRYGHKLAKCEITRLSPGRQGGKLQNSYLVEFKEPQRAITPGQSVVFYRSKFILENSQRPKSGREEVMGGGIIA